MKTFHFPSCNEPAKCVCDVAGRIIAKQRILKALKELDEALKVSPNDPQVIYVVAVLRNKMGTH